MGSCYYDCMNPTLKKRRRRYARNQLLTAAGAVLALSAWGLEARAVENPLLAYPHLLPSPFTLPAGRIVLGTDAAFGLTDFFQIGTSLIPDIYQVFNANAKLAVLDYPDLAAALTLGWQTYDLHDIDATNPELRITSWNPGLVVGYELLPHLAHFVGGHLSFSNVTLVTDGITTSGYVQGVLGESDLSWAYNPRKKGVGNVLSGGVTYDFTYKIIGFGFSHYWPGFHLGIHYYPNATHYRVQPILAGGAAFDL